MPLVLLEECSVCDASEERVFTDSFTGKEVCIECLAPVIRQITNSPQTENDNLADLLETCDA